VTGLTNQDRERYRDQEDGHHRTRAGSLPHLHCLAIGMIDWSTAHVPPASLTLDGKLVSEDASSRTGATSDREARLRRSLRRLGYDLVEAGARGHFHIFQEGSKVNETPDLFGLDLAGVEAWIKERAKGRNQ
jgi:hypothetical protein